MNDLRAKAEPLWELRSLDKLFPGVRALHDVSLKIFPGEIHGLVGENGSGKSTLVKCLSGVHQPSSGTIYHHSQPVIVHDPTTAFSLGVATIYQERSLVPGLTVAENIFVGRLPAAGRLRLRVDWQEIYQNSAAMLSKLGIELDPRRIIEDLSVAEQQMVEIAKALSMEAQLVIMDEPTAAIGLEEIERLHGLVRNMAEHGIAILYISHRLDEVVDLVDRVTVLKDGQVVGEKTKGELSIKGIVELMIGSDVKEHYPKERNRTRELLLSVSDIHTDRGVNGASFELYRGEVFGLAGLIGMGRTEIALAIFGIDPIRRGSLHLHSLSRQRSASGFSSPQEAIRSGVALLTENRKHTGLFMNFDGPKNVSIARLDSISSYGILSLRRENEQARRYIDKLRISPAALERSVQYLSGGNQQKVIIARWMFSQADVFILDEPTQGIDVGAKVEVYNLINDLTRQGKAVILISSDFDELLAMSDRIGIVNRGRISEIREAGEIDKKYLVENASVRARSQP
jgi:ABC-type sugar transport system ATPase subunit